MIKGEWVFRKHGKIKLPKTDSPDDMPRLLVWYGTKGSPTGIEDWYFVPADDFGPDRFRAMGRRPPNSKDLVAYFLLPTTKELQAEFDKLNTISSEA